MEKEFEALKIHLDRRIADIKRYLEFNERSEDEEKFTPVYELKICYLAKEMLAIKEAKPSEFKIIYYKGQYYLQINVNDDEATQIQLPLLEDEIKDVQLAIGKFKQIKEAKPSEALKDLQALENNIVYLLSDCDTSEEAEQCLKDVKTRISTIKQALLKAQELEKELADVEKVKSGKIIIYFGKDLVMMNKNKYYEYVENENEPISKRILQAKCEELEKENTELNQHIKRWHDLLLKTGINSKGTVVDEIENYWQIKVEAKNEK